MVSVLQVGPGQWESLVAGTKPVFVDFWAEWCGPCRMVAPSFEKLAQKYSERITFAKVNVDDLPELAGRFGIRSIPTLLLLREGKVVHQVVGVRSYDELSRLLDQYATTTVPA